LGGGKPTVHKILKHFLGILKWSLYFSAPEYLGPWMAASAWRKKFEGHPGQILQGFIFLSTSFTVTIYLGGGKPTVHIILKHFL
jgi:hypothetical protein